MADNQESTIPQEEKIQDQPIQPKITDNQESTRPQEEEKKQDEPISEQEPKIEKTITIDNNFTLSSFLKDSTDATHLTLDFTPIQSLYDSEQNLLPEILSELNKFNLYNTLKSLTLSFCDSNLENQQFILPEIECPNLNELIFKFKSTNLSNQNVSELSKIYSQFRALVNCEVHFNDIQYSQQPYWNFINELLISLSTHPSYILQTSIPWFNSVMNVWVKELQNSEEDCMKLIPLIMACSFCRHAKFCILRILQGLERDQGMGVFTRRRQIAAEIVELIDFEMNREQ